MFDKKRIEDDFGQAASRYDSYAQLQKLVRASAIAVAHKYLKSESHILDLGCGTGALTSEVPWRITGVDISPGMCEMAKKRGVAVKCTEAEHLPFADHSFDGVFLR
jgi:ubiquinone/menaquinone biosynthesis C-methylase UbiE